MFIVADPIHHRDALLQLNIEFMSWNKVEIERLFDVSLTDVVGMPIPEYVANTIDKVCGEAPPRGIFIWSSLTASLPAWVVCARCVKGYAN